MKENINKIGRSEYRAAWLVSVFGFESQYTNINKYHKSIIRELKPIKALKRDKYHGFLYPVKLFYRDKI